MGFEIYQVDAFTDQPFAGNPAAVCLVAGATDDRWKQNVAAEMNLSETAFVEPAGEGFGLRWFTPQQEVNLCGHATLATAHILWETGRLNADQPAIFETRSGRLSATRDGTLIEIDLPARPAQPIDIPTGLVEAIDTTPSFVGSNGPDILVELPSETAVRGLRLDAGLLRPLKSAGVIITAASTTEAFDFVSRYFAPNVGIDEDPVTGAAHCCLGPYWKVRLGKAEMLAYQASERGGKLRVRVVDDRVILGGHAVTVMRGELAD